MFQPPLQGLIAATTTPLQSDGSLDLHAIKPMIDRLINSGVDGFYVCGSTGEGMSLSTEEREAVVERTVQAVDGRAVVLVQVGHQSLAEARRLAAHASRQGVDAVSATCPSYFKVTNVSTLVECMAEIAAAAPRIPFYYYHIPGLTGSPIDPVEFLARGAERIENLVGMKYTATLVHEFQSCCRLENGRFDVVWGCDEMWLSGLVTGARAAIGSTYNIAAPLYRKLTEAVRQGDLQQARDLQWNSVRMIEVLKQFPFHAALKSTMSMLGMPGGPCRLPLETLNDSQHGQLRADLQQIGFFQWCGHPVEETGESL